MNETQKFCGYCGKPLVDGICTCDQFTEKFTSLKKPEKSRNIKLNILSYITNPIATSIKQSNESKSSIPICIGLIHLIIVYVIMFIVTEINSISLITASMVAVTNISFAALSWVFAKIIDNKCSFKTYLSKYCIATVIPSLFLILSCTGFFLLWPFCIVFLVLSVLSWAVISLLFLKEEYEIRETAVFWAFMGMCTITILILIALGVVFNKQIISTIAGTNLIGLFI